MSARSAPSSPPTEAAVTYVLLAAVTLLVAGIGTRTALALARGDLLTAAPSPASARIERPVAAAGRDR